ncbi:MAG: ATPase, T2SS/T4P/T4SS family [Kofleriaceae bacterium]
MARIDVYLRSIERFGAAGAVLTSGQAVTLKFPAGDRNATQVVAHDQLVAMVREIAPPPALDQIDAGRPARFEFESNSIRYGVSVAPKPNLWQVTIDGPATPAVAAAAPAAAPVRTPRVQTAPVADTGGDLAIERGQYAEGAPAETPAGSGSAFLDALTHAARTARASDLYLATGVAPLARTAGDVRAIADRGALDAETISRELGAVAPAEARAAWTEHGSATFTYGDGMGRVRVTLARDHRGPGAALRLLVAEPPALDRIGLPREVAGWLERRGLVLVAGAAGSGKSTTLAALVKALGDQSQRVVTIEDPIELVHASTFVSQRAIGEHVASVAAGVTAAMREGADAICVASVASRADAVAVIAAVDAGQLVLVGVAAASAAVAVGYLVALAGEGNAVVERGFLGAVAGVVQGGTRRFEVVGRSD